MSDRELHQQSLYKYLDLIEDCIKRMASNSFIFKGWSLTVVAAILALNHDNLQLSVFAGVGIAFVMLVFGILDAYYLSMERSFRDIYKDVVNKANDGNYGDIDWYSLKIPKPTFCKIMGVFWSKSVGIFYLPVIIVSLLIFVLVPYLSQSEDSVQKVQLENETVSLSVQELDEIKQEIADLSIKIGNAAEAINEVAKQLPKQNLEKGDKAEVVNAKQSK